MKCVQEIKTNHITRVKNEQAEYLVKSGTHTYVCKAAWKEAVRPDYTPHAYRKYVG